MGVDVRRDKSCREVDTDCAAAFCDSTNHLIGQVAGMWGQGTAVGMGSHKRFVVFLADAHNIPEAAVGQMGNVGNDAHAVHRINHLAAKGFKRQCHLFRVKGIWIAQAVFMVPGNRNQTDSHFVHLFQTCQRAVDSVSILCGQEAGNLAFLFVAEHIVQVACKGSIIAVFFQIFIEASRQCIHKVGITWFFHSLCQKTFLRHQAHCIKLRGKAGCLQALKVYRFIVFVQVDLFPVSCSQQCVAVHIDHFQDKSLQSNIILSKNILRLTFLLVNS